MYVIFRQSVLMTLLLALLLCGAYPLLVTSTGQALFPSQAGGSLIVHSGRILGSRLIGQRFTAAQYFHGRPSAAGQGYDAQASGGSNLGPLSAVLAKRMEAEARLLRGDNPGNERLPSDLLTASGSGLDPHISPEAARLQMRRVAMRRGLSVESVRSLIAARTQGPEFGFLGPELINVLELNLALDALQP